MGQVDGGSPGEVLANLITKLESGLTSFAFEPYDLGKSLGKEQGPHLLNVEVESENYVFFEIK